MLARWWVALLVSLWMSTGMLTLFGTTIMLPAISEEFHTSPATTAWAASVFPLVLAGTFVPGSQLGNLLGFRKVSLVASYIEVVILAMIFFVPNFALLIGLRLISGLFRGAVVPNYNAMAISQFPEEERGKALGAISALSGFGSLFTLAVVGLITEVWGWRWVFLGSSGLFLSINLLVTFTFPSGSQKTPPQGALKQFDLKGAVWLMLCVALFLVGVQMVGREGTGVWPFGLILSSVVLGFSLVRFEVRQPRPVLPVVLFKSRTISIPSWFNFLFTFTNGISLYLLPMLFIQGLHWDAAYAGSVLIALNAARPFGSIVSGFMSDKIGPSPVVITASIVLIASVLGLAFGGSSGKLLILIPILVVFGFGQSLFATANMKQMYAAVPASLLAFAPGALGLGRHIGTTAGIGIASTIFAAFLVGGQFLTEEQAVSSAYQVVLIATSGFLAIGIVIPSLLSLVGSKISTAKGIG